MYRCRVEKDSISPRGDRLTSFVIELPRVVLAELATHRVVSDSWGDFDVSCYERTTTKDISKNSASSRAIPFSRMLAKVRDDPYMPAWTLNQKGMQGGFMSNQQQMDGVNAIWLAARDEMCLRAEQLVAHHVHKQDCNRLLEPWAWVTQIVTSSRWDNFFALRCHRAAHPALQRIARMMYLAMRRSTPDRLEYGQWHLPFVSREESLAFEWLPNLGSEEPLPDLIKFSAARCAWISYENHDKDGTPEAMLRTFDRLLGEVPVHASPCEHQATPWGRTVEVWINQYRSNLVGWLQARKLVRHERIDRFDPSEEEIASWGIDEAALWPALTPLP